MKYKYHTQHATFGKHNVLNTFFLFNLNRILHVNIFLYGLENCTICLKVYHLSRSTIKYYIFCTGKKRKPNKIWTFDKV